jgi:hypothetical protein
MSPYIVKYAKRVAIYGTKCKLWKSPMHKHPFYGHHILLRNEREYIETLLKKYKKEPVSEELKKKIWDELQMEKHFGRITVPFKLKLVEDPSGKFPPTIEVILETKV